jgi:hypothetical protein
MSLSNGPAEASGHSPRTAAGGEPSPYAPKWVRDGRMSQRKVVPLHLPAAPQLVPGASPVEAAAASPAPRIPRPSGPELLAEDAVLKRLLQRHSPDPQPTAVQPVRDPVGLALGMVARLIVAGCAAAAVVMLLLGVIPLPFRLGAVMGSDIAPAVTTLPAVAAAVPQPQQVADAGAVTGSVSNVPAGTDAAAAPPARVATVSVRAAQAGGTDPWALDAGEVERLVVRGEAYLAQGDIAAARLILGRAAEARDPRAAFSLAATYDPAVLKQLHVVGFKPDVAQARAWYEKAAGYGSTEASRRLAALPN